MSTLCLPDVTARDQISPSVFAYCKQSNNGGGNGLGTRLRGSSSDSLGMGRATVCCAEGESTIQLQQVLGCEKPFAILRLSWNPNYSGVFGV